MKNSASLFFVRLERGLDMKWKKIVLETTTDAVDLVSAMLDELGIEGIEIQDNVQLSEEDKKIAKAVAEDGKDFYNHYEKETRVFVVEN